jgi:uncharacterized membrane protein
MRYGIMNKKDFKMFKSYIIFYISLPIVVIALDIILKFPFYKFFSIIPVWFNFIALIIVVKFFNIFENDIKE